MLKSAIRSTIELDISWVLGADGGEKEVLELVEIFPVGNTNSKFTITVDHLHNPQPCVCVAPQTHTREVPVSRHQQQLAVGESGHKPSGPESSSLTIIPSPCASKTID